MTAFSSGIGDPSRCAYLSWDNATKVMKVRKFNVASANLVRSPAEDGDIVIRNLVDEKDGVPITIGYGRYGPGKSLTKTMDDDVMFVLEVGSPFPQAWERRPPG